VTLNVVDAFNAVRLEARVNGTYDYPACMIAMVSVGESELSQQVVCLLLLQTNIFSL